MKNIKVIKVDKKVIDMLQACYEDYRAKQDIITMIFELHKYDTDASVVESAPFKHYEKQFMESKIKYDTTMEEIRQKYIPEELKIIDYRYDVDFDKCTINIRG